MGGEIIEAVASKVGERLELVFLHESEKTFAQRLHEFIAEFHHAGANLHGVARRAG